MVCCVAQGSNRGRPRSQHVDSLVREGVLALLDEVGYNRLAIEQVAQRAGVGKSAIYRRWNSKAEMVFALVLHDVDLSAPASTGSLRGDLTVVARELMASFATPAARSAIPGLIADLSCDAGLVERFAATFNASETASVEVILRRALERGELAAMPDPAEVHMLLTGPLFMWLFAYARESCDDFAVRLADVVTSGLVRTAGSG